MSKKNAKSKKELLNEALVPVEEQPYELPENWVWVKLGKVIDVNPPKRKMFDIKDNDIFSFIPMAAVSDIEGVIFAPEEREFKQVKTGYTQFVDGDVIFAKITPCMENGKSAIVRELKNGIGYGSTEFYVLRTNGIIDNRLLYQLVRSSSFRTEAKRHMTGAVGQQRVPKKFIENYPFPLPPLNEQKRIADKVERLLDKINQAKQLIEEAKATFELRRAAILDKAFRGELTKKWREEHNNLFPKKGPISEGINVEEIPYQLPEGWQWARLKDVGTLERGRSKHRPRNDSKLFGGDYPFIQTGDVAKAGDYIESYNQTLSEFGLLQSKLFPEDTVCITIAANIADTAILKFPCCFPDSVVGFTPKDGYISSTYLHYYMRTIKSNLEHYAPATAQKNINLKVLQEILVPVPPKLEHDEMLHVINSLLTNEDQASSKLDTISELERLEQSILRKAFQGKLGTHDPREELVFTDFSVKSDI